MYDVSSAMAIVNEERQIGGFAKICNTTSFFDGSSGELGLHELGHGAVAGSLLGSLGLGELG